VVGTLNPSFCKDRPTSSPEFGLSRPPMCEQDMLEYVACESILSNAHRRALAALRATISICAELLRILTAQPWESEGFQWADEYAGEILAAWPEELL